MSTKPKYRIVFRTYYSIQYVFFIDELNRVFKWEDEDDKWYRSMTVGRGVATNFEKAQYEYHGDFNH